MKQQKALINLLYGYIGFAFFMVLLEILGVFEPIPGILAAGSLLTACYCIGKYSNASKTK